MLTQFPEVLQSLKYFGSNTTGIQFKRKLFAVFKALCSQKSLLGGGVSHFTLPSGICCSKNIIDKVRHCGKPIALL